MIPRVILHNAVSVDGRVNAFRSNLSLYYGMASHWNEDVTLAGSGTILRAGKEAPSEREGDWSHPRVTASPGQKDPRPLLVVPDSGGRIRNLHYWYKQSYWRDLLILCSESTPSDYIKYLEERNVKYLITGKMRIDFEKALETLYEKHEARTVRVDSGGTLNGVLLRSKLVSDISLLINPALIGGMNQHSIYRSPDLQSYEHPLQCKLTHMEQVKDDYVWLVYKVLNR